MPSAAARLVDLQPAFVEAIDIGMVQVEDRIERRDRNRAHQPVRGSRRRAMAQCTAPCGVASRRRPNSDAGASPSWRLVEDVTAAASPAVPLLSCRPARLRPERVRHGRPRLVRHRSARGTPAAAAGSRRVVPVGQGQRRVVGRLPQHALEVVEEHPVPGQELVGAVLALAPGRVSLRGRWRSRARRRPCRCRLDRPASTCIAEMRMHVGPVDPAAAGTSALPRDAVLRDIIVATPAPKRHQLGTASGR